MLPHSYVHTMISCYLYKQCVFFIYLTNKMSGHISTHYITFYCSHFFFPYLSGTQVNTHTHTLGFTVHCLTVKGRHSDKYSIAVFPKLFTVPYPFRHSISSYVCLLC